MIDDIKDVKKTVGVRQSQKAVAGGLARRVYVASDASDKVRIPFINLCREHNVEIEMVESMGLLGEICGIDVGAAVAAVIEG